MQDGANPEIKHKVDLGETINSVKPAHVENLISAIYTGLINFLKSLLSKPIAWIILVVIFAPFLIIMTISVVGIIIVFLNISKPF